MSIDEEARALGRIPMFQALEPGQLRLVAFSSSRLKVAEGEALFHQGDISDAAYVLLEGTALIEVSAEGTTVEVARLTPDSLVGEMGILTGGPRTATVRAGSPMVVLRLERELFLDLMDRTPALARSVLKDLASRLQETTQALVRARTQ